MYEVIFKGKVVRLDDQYAQVAERIRKLAREGYGCVELYSVTGGSKYRPLIEKRLNKQLTHFCVEANGNKRFHQDIYGLAKL